MNLRVWFDPRAIGEMRQSSIERKSLGAWELLRLNKLPSKEVYGHVEELRLPDGSVLQVSATCDRTFEEPSTTIGVSSASNLLFEASMGGWGNIAISVATGKGGYLELQFWFEGER